MCIRDRARAGGLRGSVVLQVLIGRDGAVQDAKFLQGSLVFARAAVDAVKPVSYTHLDVYKRQIQYRSQYRGFVDQPAFGEAR